MIFFAIFELIVVKPANLLNARNSFRLAVFVAEIVPFFGFGTLSVFPRKRLALMTCCTGFACGFVFAGRKFSREVGKSKGKFGRVEHRQAFTFWGNVVREFMSWHLRSEECESMPLSFASSGTTPDSNRDKSKRAGREPICDGQRIIAGNVLGRRQGANAERISPDNEWRKPPKGCGEFPT